LSFNHCILNLSIGFKNYTSYILVLCSILFLSSCNVVKRVKSNEHLITKNTVLVDRQTTKDNTVNNLIIQKTNTGMRTVFGIPLRLHIYNLARPNFDSIIETKVLNDSSKLKHKTKWLSKKQLYKELQFRRNFNSWLKRTGEAPTILDEDKTKKTVSNLKKYYISKGWFEAEVDYDILKNDNKRAEVTYKVTKNDAYILDSIRVMISSPSIKNLYKDFKTNSLLKKGTQFDAENYTKERERITTYLRNSGFYHFSKDYLRFETDTIDTNKKVNTDLIIGNRIVRGEDSTFSTPFKPYKIKAINIFTDERFDNQSQAIRDTTIYDDFNLYSKNGLKYRPKALTNAIFMHKGDTYSDLDRRRSLRYLNDLQMFRYPTIAFQEHPQDSTLTANIFLQPRKKYELTFNVDVSQSNIQTVGFSFGSGIKVRNIFKGAETLELSGIASIGASKDPADDNDVFFDINEFGANLRLTIPRLFSPFNTDKIIPKYMSPSTAISATVTSQQNIGLDKQTFASIFSYNWLPSEKVTNTLELLNIQFVRNLNTGNYFDVYNNSFNRLNTIAQNINYINSNAALSIPTQANQFIDDVLAGNTSLTATNDDFISVSNIKERRDRLTENNLILSSSFDYIRNSRQNIFDNEFSVFKWRVELAGNLLSGISNLLNRPQNDDGNYQFLDVTFSQYVKTEVDYVNYSDLGQNSVFAFRTYAGIAIPYGNSNSIPFVESFFGGGPNDNRAWTAYNLGPGSSSNLNLYKI